MAISIPQSFSISIAGVQTGAAHVDRRRIGADRRQAPGIAQQVSEDRRQNGPDRRRAMALAQAITELARVEIECASAESTWTQTYIVWNRALTEYEIVEADWSEARAGLAKARAVVSRAQAKVEEVKRS